VELVSPEDLPRFRELGVVACMQPRHASPDLTGQWARAVGPARWPRAFPWAGLLRAGATLAFASDWNVAEMDPLVGIYTALTRQGLDGSPPGGWVPEQRVELAAALRAYTRDGAFANFVEGDRGSLAPGHYADLILLSDDLFALPPERIPRARVLLTLLGGEVVYTQEGAAPSPARAQGASPRAR
jgi:predicted amidohydrolase YtcJ